MKSNSTPILLVLTRLSAYLPRLRILLCLLFLISMVLLL